MAASTGDVERLAAAEIAGRAGLVAFDETLKALRSESSQAQERRSMFEVELVKKQAELKYLDETSRKELNALLDELAQQQETVLDETGLAEAIRREERAEWLRRNRAAIEAYNEHVEKHGVFSDGLRSF